MKTGNIIGYFLIGFLVIYGTWLVINKNAEPVESNRLPIMASNMTEKERGQIDNKALLRYLEEYDVEKVAVGYSYNSIKVYIRGKSSDQYVSTVAEKIRDSIRSNIETHRSELTLENDQDEYHIFIYGKDGNLIN